MKTETKTRSYTIPASSIKHFDYGSPDIKSANVLFRDKYYENVKVYDDDSDGMWYLVGHEFGPDMLIRAGSFDSAFEIYVDESKPVPCDEIHEAYGIIDWLRDLSGFDWHQSDDCVSYEANADMAKRLMSVFFEDGRNEQTDKDDWIPILREEFPALTNDQRSTLADALTSLPDHGWELDEGYQHQSNATDSGIVNLGHYHWQDEIDPDNITLQIESEEIHADIAGEYDAIKCILDGSRGIYIPQSFADFEGWGIKDDDKAILLNPEHEHYWDVWDDVLDYAKFTDDDGYEWHLMQDGDLFVVRNDVHFD